MSSHADSMVDGRDFRIAHLEELLQEQYEGHASVLAELSAVKVQSAQDRCRASLELQELRNENEILHRRLAQLADDMDKKALHEYATVIVEATPSTINSAYIVRLQSKVCKAIHQRGVWGNQLTMLKESFQKVVKSLQDDVVDAVNDKCQAEMCAMNKVLQAEKEKSLVRAECEDKINSIRLECGEKLKSQRREIEKLRIHLDIVKGMKTSLGSVCTQQGSEERASLGEKKKKMSRENTLTQEDIESINEVVDQRRMVSEDKSMHFSGNAVEVNDQISKNVVPSNRIGQRLSQLRSSLTPRSSFVEQLTIDLGRNFKEIGRPRRTGNITLPSPEDKLQKSFLRQLSLASIAEIEDKKEFGAMTA